MPECILFCFFFLSCFRNRLIGGVSGAVVLFSVAPSFFLARAQRMQLAVVKRGLVTFL